MMLGLILTFAVPMYGQSAGSLDTSFGQSDRGFGYGDGVSGWHAFVSDVFHQSDGKLLLLGRFSAYDRVPKSGIARLKPNGDLDTSYSTNGGFVGDCIAGVLQPDGKLVVTGSFTSVDGVAMNLIARLDQSGNVDTTFHPGTGLAVLSFPPAQGRCLALQADGRILVGGLFNSMDGYPRNGLVRLNGDGTVDTTFQIGGGFTGYQYPQVNAILVQPDGRILVGGEFFRYDGVEVGRFLRLMPDGSLDTTFMSGTGFTRVPHPGLDGNPRVEDMAFTADGRIAVVGEFNRYNGTNRNRICVLLPDGQLDQNFFPGSGFRFSAPLSILPLPDGRFIVGGGGGVYNDISYGGSIAKINQSGSLDNAFSIPIFGGSALDFLPDGRIFSQNSVNSRLNQGSCIFFQNGSIDHTYAPGSGGSGRVSVVAEQPDQKLILGGSFGYYDRYWSPFIARAFPDGSVDTTFQVDLPIRFAPRDIVVRPNGRILLSYIPVGESPCVVQLLPSGAVDPTFSTTIMQSAGTLHLDPDGKLLVGGYIEPWGGSRYYGIERLELDGSFDSGFNVGTGTLDTSSVQDSTTSHVTNVIRTLQDGRIVLGGSFRMIDGNPAFGIARLMPNGAVDNSFSSGTGFAESIYLPDSVTPYAIHDIEVQPDGRMLVSGTFSEYNGATVRSVIRLNPDGTLDGSFDVGSGSDTNEPVLIELQSDGRVIVAGGFSAFNGSPANDYVRLESNGALDFSFDAGVGAQGAFRPLDGLRRTSDDGVVICGDFTNVDGIGRNRVAKILTQELITTAEQTDMGKALSIAFPNPTTGMVQVKTRTGIFPDDAVNVCDLTGSIVWRGHYGAAIDMGHLCPGIYILEVPRTQLRVVVVRN